MSDDIQVSPSLAKHADVLSILSSIDIAAVNAKIQAAIAAHEDARFVEEDGTKLRLHPRVIKIESFSIHWAKDFPFDGGVHGLRASIAFEVESDRFSDEEVPAARSIHLDIPLD